MDFQHVADESKKNLVYDSRPDVIGLAAHFGWLPSQVLDEDWALLSELQERVTEQNENREVEAWAAKVRQTFG